MVAFFSAIDALLWCMEVQKTLAESDWPEDLTAQPGSAKQITPEGQIIFSGW
jgi:hypothetical protein